ncbi:MAG: hypothetical protein IJD77_00885 [Clostridia bacterium]|nr:hypothetical protein [Clostridia bacterium]
MGRKIEIVCDKCGAEIDSYNQKNIAAKLVIWGIGVNRYNEGQRIDFCEDCFEEFLAMYENFMAN